MTVTLHRFARTPEPGDLTLGDLVVIWGILKAENLVGVFFHDGGITSLPEFIRHATDETLWFYGAKQGGAFIGFGVVNNFSSNGNTAFVHLCSFAGGRTAGDSASSPFAEAGRQWFRLLHDIGGIDTVIALFPARYRGLAHWVKIFGFVERMRLPGALRLVRPTGVRVSDAIVCSKAL